MTVVESENPKNQKNTVNSKNGDSQSSYNQLNVTDSEINDDIVSIITQLEQVVTDSNYTTEPAAIEKLVKLLSEASSTHSSLPKQYTYLFSNLNDLEQIIETIPEHCIWKKKLCSIFSVVCTISPKRGSCLKYYFKGLSDWDITFWGLEYAKHLSEDIRLEYGRRFDQVSDADHDSSPPTNNLQMELDGITNDELFSLATRLIKFLVSQNAELDACDLAMEIEDLDLIYDIVNESNFQRLLYYLRQCCNFLFETELDDMLVIIFKCYLRYGCFAQALLVAIKRNKALSIIDLLTSWDNYTGFKDEKHKQLVIKQITYMLRHYEVSIDELIECIDSYLVYGVDSAKRALNFVIEYNSPSLISDNYELVIRELDVNHPKKIEDICKEPSDKVTMFFNSRTSDNPRVILANFLSSGFLNAGFKESFVHDDSERSYISKVRDYPALTAAASYGFINLFDTENGLLSMDKFLYSPDHSVKSGALLGCGVLSVNNPDASQTTLAILSTSILHSENKQELIAAMIGLAISMANQRNNDALDILDKIFNQYNQRYIDLDIISYYAISVGMIGLGSCKVRECKNLFDYIIKMKDRLVIQDINATYLIFGYSLLYFNTQDIDSLENDFRQQIPSQSYPVLSDYISTFLRISAYAGSGHTMIVQSLLMQISNLFDANPNQMGPNSEQETNDSIPTSPKNDNPAVNSLPGRIENIILNEDSQPGSLNANASGTAKSDSNTEKMFLKSDSSKADKKKITVDDSNLNNEDSQTGDTFVKRGKVAGVIHGSQLLKDNDTTGNQMLAAVSAIGIAAVCVSEDPIVVNMCFRQFNNLLQFGDRYIRRTVPFGLAIIGASNPEISFIDTLNRLAYDSDSVTACNAILALGIVGAGTNNSKIGGLLRDLINYYYKDQTNIFTIRVALGLLHAGRGMLTMSPYMGCKSFVNQMSLASLLLFTIANIDSKSKALGNEHYLFCWLACCLKPRFLITFDEEGNHIQVPVRVGTSVDTAGMAGDPRTVTGFQTQNTPVVLGTNEKAELVNSDYEALSYILEGIVIVRKRDDADTIS